MPLLNGVQLADRLTGVRPQMKVAFMSGHTANALDRHDLLTPVFVLPQKPFATSMLLCKVREALDG